MTIHFNSAARALLLVSCLSLLACGDDSPLPSCGDDSALSLSACVDEARYRADLQFAARVRPPGSPGWQAVQDLCATTLEDSGFTVEHHVYDTGVNIIGTLPGDSPDDRVLVGAHYDHIEGCVGADDNATGVAGVLEVARVLSRRRYPRTLVVACWDEEERGLLGSAAYANQESTAGRDFDVYFNFEMIGYTDDSPGSQSLPLGFDLLFPGPAARIEGNRSRGDFIALIGDEASSPYLDSMVVAADAHGLPSEPLPVPDSLLSSPLLADLRRSDHDSFWQTGVPAILITDTSEFRYAGYHCGDGPDDPSRLNMKFASAVVAATVSAAAEALGLPR